MKKLAIFLVLAMLLCMSAGAAPAELSVEALVEVPADAGNGTVILTISVEEAVAAGTITVSYDNALLTYVSCDALTDMASVKDTGSAVKLVCSNLEAKAGDLAVVTFEYDSPKSSTVVEVKADLTDEAGETAKLSRSVTVELPEEAVYCPSRVFTDVDRTRWYHEAVDYVVSEGLMNGMTTTAFGPDAATTRAQFVTVLSRLAGADVSVYADYTAFDDVDLAKWYAPYVAWAADTGLVQGDGNGLFRPESSISRQEMVTILARYAGAQGGDTSILVSFDDADQVAGWAAPSVSWAVENGIIQGFDNRLEPAGSTTRAQIAQVIMNYANAE